MNKNGINHRILYLLAPASVIIWVMIIHKLFWQINEINSASLPAAMDAGFLEKQIDMKQDYDSLFSDLTPLANPFRPPISFGKRYNLQAVEKDLPPRIRFTGYMTDGKTPLAILEFNEGTTVIGREGEGFDDWQVKRIEPSVLSIQYKDSIYVFRLNQ